MRSQLSRIHNGKKMRFFKETLERNEKISQDKLKKK